MYTRSFFTYTKYCDFTPCELLLLIIYQYVLRFLFTFK